MVYKKAFTIVELLVVVVVIGILAIISLVAYSGITQKANVATIISDLNSASKQLKIFNVSNDVYPSSISDCPTPSVGSLCLKSSSDTFYQYTAGTNNKFFCLTATKSTISYNLTQEGRALAGSCPILNLDAGNTLSYPGSGTNFYDLSGNDNTGTLINGVSYQSVDGGVMNFDGGDDYVQINNNSSFNLTSTNHSMVSWFNISSAPVDTPNGMILQRFTGGAPGAGYYMGINNVGRIYYNERCDGGNNLDITSPAAYIDSSWHQVVVSVDIVSRVGKMYVDGVYVSSDIYAGNTLDHNANLTLGGQGTSYSFLGKLSNVSIIKYLLSDTEVFQNYNVAKGRYGL